VNKTEARKNIIKTNKLRKEIDRLTDRLWREPISGRGFTLCKDRLKKAREEMADGNSEHREALKAYLGS